MSDQSCLIPMSGVKKPAFAGCLLLVDSQWIRHRAGAVSVVDVIQPAAQDAAPRSARCTRTPGAAANGLHTPVEQAIHADIKKDQQHEQNAAKGAENQLSHQYPTAIQETSQVAPAPPPLEK